MPPVDARQSEETLLRHLIRITTPSQKQRADLERRVRKIEMTAELVERASEAAQQLAAAAEKLNMDSIAEKAHDIEQELMRHEYALMMEATGLLNMEIEIHPDHADAWVSRLYDELADVREALSVVFGAVITNIDATEELRQQAERIYADLVARLEAAQDDPVSAVAVFARLVKFVEIILELALKFGGPVERAWLDHARDVVTPLLR